MNAPRPSARAKAIAAHPHAFAPLPLTPLKVARPVKSRSRPQSRRRKRAPHGGVVGAIGRFLYDMAIVSSVTAAVMLVGLERLAPFSTADTKPLATTASADAPLWLIDLNGDGAPDLANPTLNFIRGEDAYGSGEFHAARDGGKRQHEGADFIVAAGATVFAPVTGTVTKIGYAYVHNSSLRFIELTDEALHLVARVFYVDSPLAVGDSVKAGDVLGVAQDLARKYPRGITNHVHVEISDGHGFMFNPAEVLPPAGAPLIFAALKSDRRWEDAVGPMLANSAMPGTEG